MSNFLQAVRRLDRRIFILLAAGLLVLLGLNFFWVAPATSALGERTAEVTAEKNELVKDQSRLAELQGGGTGTVETLLKKVALMERALPQTADDLAISKKAAAAATASGAVMGSFQPSGEFTKVNKQVGYRSFTFTVSGTVSQVVSWLDTMERDPTNIVVYTDLKLGADSAPASEDAEQTGTGVFGPGATASGTMRVYFSLVDPILVLPEASATPAVPSDPAAPADPAVQPSVPVSSSPAPVSPAAPVPAAS